MYHFFPSKKELVLSVIREILSPKMEFFFSFQSKNYTNAIDIILETIENIGKNENLVKNNCPLNRLNIELSNSDQDFDKELNKIFRNIQNKLIDLLKNSISKKEIQEIEPVSLSEFIMTSTWGALSLSASNSSKTQFFQNTQHLKNYLLSLKLN